MSERLKYIIGGSASTGSSLLAHMIDNHSQMSCGPETNLFVHPSLISDWNFNKNEINTAAKRKKILSQSWHVHKGVQLDHFKASDQLDRLINAEQSFSSFLDNLFLNYDTIDDITGLQKPYFVEKTPSNAVHFQSLVKVFPDTAFVLTIRNPYDAVASMTNRGWSTLYAVGLYLFNISLGCYSSERLIIVKYEDLLDNGKATIEEILKAGGLSYEEGLELHTAVDRALPSWSLGDSSLSTFEALPKDKQQEIAYYIDHLQVKSNTKCYGYSFSFLNIREIVDEFGYRLLSNHKSSLMTKTLVKAEIAKEKVKRAIKGYNFALGNFPFEHSVT